MLTFHLGMKTGQMDTKHGGGGQDQLYGLGSTLTLKSPLPRAYHMLLTVE